MQIRRFVLALVLVCCGAAVADIVTVIDAVETATSNMNVPTSDNGRLMFRPCAGECDKEFIVVRLTPATRFLVQNRPVDFLEFRKVFFDTWRGQDGYALVSFEADTSVATSVSIGH